METDKLSNIEAFLNEANLILKNFEMVESKSNSLNYVIDSLFRTYDILNSISLIKKNESNLRYSELSIGLLLRTGLSDFIHCQYYSNKCISKGLFDAKKFEYEISEYISGHFNRIDQSHELIKEYKEHIGIDELKNKTKYKEINIIRDGLKTAKEKKLTFLKSAVEFWEWYSKYEHYGLFTNSMLINFDNKNLIRMNESVGLLFVNFYYCLLTIKDINPNLYDLGIINELEQMILEK